MPKTYSQKWVANYQSKTAELRRVQNALGNIRVENVNLHARLKNMRKHKRIIEEEQQRRQRQLWEKLRGKAEEEAEWKRRQEIDAKATREVREPLRRPIKTAEDLKKVQGLAVFPNETLREYFLQLEKSLDEYLPQVQEDISNTVKHYRDNRNQEESARFFESIILGELKKFLLILIEAVRVVDESWREYILYWIIKYNVTFFESMLKTCFDNDRLALRQAANNVSEKLERMKLWKPL